MKNNNSNLSKEDLLKIANSIHGYKITETKSISISQEVNQLLNSLYSQSFLLDYDSESFSFSDILISLKGNNK